MSGLRNLLRMGAALLGNGPCRHCGGRPRRIKRYREAGGELLDEPGFSDVNAGPGPCPHCAEAGEVHSIIVMMPAPRVDRGGGGGLDCGEQA